MWFFANLEDCYINKTYRHTHTACYHSTVTQHCCYQYVCEQANVRKHWHFIIQLEFAKGFISINKCCSHCVILQCCDAVGRVKKGPVQSTVATIPKHLFLVTGLTCSNWACVCVCVCLVATSEICRCTIKQTENHVLSPTLVSHTHTQFLFNCPFFQVRLLPVGPVPESRLLAKNKTWKSSRRID